MDEDSEIDVSAQMGFNSFGAQPSVKKRKYNPAADAFTSAAKPDNISTFRVPSNGQRGAHSPSGRNPSVRGSGGNRTPLGQRNGQKVTATGGSPPTTTEDGRSKGNGTSEKVSLKRTLEID
jgi:hypothetical protein